MRLPVLYERWFYGWVCSDLETLRPVQKVSVSRISRAATPEMQKIGLGHRSFDTDGNGRDNRPCGACKLVQAQRGAVYLIILF